MPMDLRTYSILEWTAIMFRVIVASFFVLAFVGIVPGLVIMMIALLMGQ